MTKQNWRIIDDLARIAKAIFIEIPYTRCLLDTFN